MFYYYIIFSVAIILSYFCVSLAKYIGHKYDILLYPQADRWHSRPIAIHGGLGFFPVLVLLIIFTTSMYSPLNSLMLDENIYDSVINKIFGDLSFLIGLIGSTLILFVFGWLDDILKFRARSKLLVQIIVSSIFIFDFGTFQLTDIEFLNFLYTLFWFVGIINATNLIDCMDGLCAGVLVIVSIFLGVILVINQPNSEQYFFSINLLVLFAGVLIGFLILNFPPAKIFMGDAGSLPLGFIIAALTLPTEFNTFANNQNMMQQVLIPIALLSYPIMDTTLVVITRVLNKKKFYIGGKDHSCHRLVNLGLSDKQSILICYLYTFIGGLTALLIEIFPESFSIFFLLLLILSIVSVIYLFRLEQNT